MNERLDKLSLETEFYGLPPVSLEIVPPKVQSKGTMKFEQLVIRNESGEEIGSAVLNLFDTSKGESWAYLNTITIKEELRGKGYGKSTYLELIKMLGNTKFKSGSQLSRGSLKVWEWLSVNGLASKVNEGDVNEKTENAAYSSAEYETNSAIGNI